jgi:hypothetical protein
MMTVLGSVAKQEQLRSANNRTHSTIITGFLVLRIQLINSVEHIPCEADSHSACLPLIQHKNSSPNS